MIELMFILYLIELLSTLDSVAYLSTTFLVVLPILSPLLVMMAQDIWGIEVQDIYDKFIKPNIKRYILALSILFSVAILIPSERTMYIMAGLYAGDKVLDTVSQSETFQKAEQLLNQKLDEMLKGEEKSND